MTKCFAFCDNPKNNKGISDYFLKSETLTPGKQVQPVLKRLALESLSETVQSFELEQPLFLNKPEPIIEPFTEPFIEDICLGIDGYGFVLMANQEYKQIYNLNKGDVVVSFDQNNFMIPSKIKYIVKTKINNLIMMSYMNNVAISSNHKIQLNNSDWFYPKYFLDNYNSKIDYLYNIVLENGCGIVVNNIKVITLGYLNTRDRDISYYATQAFVDDIAKYDINNDGYIVLEKQ